MGEFVRTARAAVPQVSTGDIAVRRPPRVPRVTPPNPITRLVPVVMVVATVGMVVFYFSATAPSGRNPMFALFPVMMLASVVGSMAYAGRGGKRTAEVNDDRREYLKYLGGVQGDAAAVAASQRARAQWCHPDPASLWSLVGGRRMWERSCRESDFGYVRVGVAGLPLAARLVVDADDRGDRAESDPVTEDALRALLDAVATVPDVAVTIDLADAGVVTVTGDVTEARAVVRACLCQLAVFHGPDDVAVSAVVDDARRPEWDWLKWLPHHHDPARGAAWLVAVADGRPVDVAALRSRAEVVTVLVIGGASHDNPVELQVSHGDFALAGVHGEVDALGVEQAAALARRMSRYRLCEARRTAEPVRGSDVHWHHLVGIDDPGRFDVAGLWGALSARSRLRVPIGVAADGGVVELDIKEAADGGVGPHGLCVGATGSGKSELLRTLVLGMVARHPPDALNLVLVDFKGGATFLGLDGLAHVAAVITNLADEAPLVARMKDALAGEVYRRQELLRSAGSFACVADYERARAGGAALAPLPALFIVIDEFSELLSQHPDLAELFAAIGRVGRSLRMHLLLASQRLDEGRMRGLETHLSYRICLKTFSASESRAAIGVTDAYELPGRPGGGYLRLGAGQLIRFESAFVSAPFFASHTPRPADHTPVRPALFTSAQPLVVPAPPTQTPAAATVMQTVVDRLRGHGVAAHRVWLPPLDCSPALGSLVPAHALAPGTLRPTPIGVVDRPFEQRRTPLVVDLAGAAGHVAIVGAPQSGKSTAVRTLVSALALTHRPTRVQFYCLDFGGGLAPLAALGHVGVVATRSQPDLVRRTVVEVESVIATREAVFAEYGVDSMADYRRRLAAGDPTLPDDPYGDVFLVVDGWATLRQGFDDVEAAIAALAGRGLSYGVHVVVTASRWAELRPAFRDLIGSRIELRLGDPAESEMDRRQARAVPELPGRGVGKDGKLTAVALPRLDGSSPSGLGAAADAIAAAVRQRWGDQLAPPVRLLPGQVDRATLTVDQPTSPRQVVIGLSERALRPVAVDFEQNPHLMVLGDVGSGKTATLRTLCREIVATHTPQQARLLIVDVRRSLLGVLDGHHLVGYAISAAAVAVHLAPFVEQLRARLPGPDVTQQQLRHRSWWEGPDLYLVVDDYDLIAAADGNPLAPIAELLPHAGDVGLHVVIARRSGGAARALYEPVLTRLRENGAAALLLSTNPDEGMLWNPVRPSLLPPGRATLATRTGTQLVQVAWTPQ